MNNTRQIKTFIGAMMAAAVITAGYAGLVSHGLHTYFALAVLVLAAVTSRMKVKLPGFNGGAMLAAEGREVQPAADGVQPARSATPAPTTPVRSLVHRAWMPGSSV